MNKCLGGLLDNLWALIGSALNFFLFILWYTNEPNWESLVGTCGASVIFLGSLYAYVFYWPSNVPKIELSHEASFGKLPPTPIPYRITGQLAGQSYQTTIDWDYVFFIRNNSSYPAFNVRFHLRDKFSGIQFPELDKVQPISLFRFTEMYLQTVERLHANEPIKPLDKVGFYAKYSKTIFSSRDDAQSIARNYFPEELSQMEILVEYKNEDEDTFFTLFTKTNENTWKNKRLKYKPFIYTRLSKSLKCSAK